MELLNGDSANELLEAHAHVWKHTFNFIKSMSLKCVVELGIPDIVHSHGQPMTLSQLVAALVHVHPSKSNHVRRLMQVLIHSGFFSLHKIGNETAYSLTKPCLLLLEDSPVSARPYLLAVLDPILTRPWDCFGSWFTSDDAQCSPFSIAHGKTFWDLAGAEKRFNTFFNEAMTSDSSIVGQVVAAECKEVFKGLSSVVDVGGNTGIMAKALVETFPNLKCTVFDLPHVVDGLHGSDHLSFVGGDMFQFIPPADAIMLKMICHVLGDEDCVKLLKKCKEAITSKGKSSGKVIIIDTVMDHKGCMIKEPSEIISLYDLEMMVLVSGEERNEKQWAKLFCDAGFTRYHINPVLGLRSLIELFP